MPTFNIWKGNAKPTRNVWHLTPADAEPGDTFNVTINGKTVSVTVTSAMAYDATLEYIPALVSALITALDLAAASIYTPEFAEVTWSAGTDDDGNSTHVIGTGPEDGKPVTISTSTGDAGAYSVSVTTLQSGTAAVNEKQKVSIPSSASGGTFTLTFAGQTTGTIAYNASAGTVQTALEALSNIASGDVTVTGASPDWTVEFKQAHAGTDVPLITGNGGSLTGACTISVTTTTQGKPSTNTIHRLSSATTTVAEFVLTIYGSDFNITHVPSLGATGLQNALATFTGFGAANFLVTQVSATAPYVYDIEYVGQLAGLDIDFTDGENADITETQTGGGTPVDEKQVVAVNGGPTGGTFTLTFQGQTTGAIAYNAGAASVKTALEALSNVTTVTVTKTGTTYLVEFDDPGGQDLQQMTGDGSSLTGASVAVVVTQSAVTAANEVQQVSLTGNPTGGTFTLTWDPGGGDETTASIAYDASASTVQTALEGLATPTAGDFLVGGSAGGPWSVEFKGTYAATNVNAMSGTPSLTGSGTQTFVASEETEATGPNWGSNANNWSLGIPTSSHTLVFESLDVSCLYGIDDMEFAGIIQRASYTGHIGLPRHTGTYYEYRNTDFTAGSGAASSLTIEIGEGDGAGSGLIRLNTSSKQTTLAVHHAASSEDGESPAVCWRGTHASNSVEVYRGSVGIGYFKGQAATVNSLLVGYRDSRDSDANVILGESVTCTADVVKTGSVLEIRCDAPSISDSAGETWIEGSAAIDILKTTGAHIYANGTGVLGTLLTITGITNANPAVVTFSAAHGLATGDKIRIASVGGMTELNQREFTVVVATSTTVQLAGENSTSHGTYTSGGVAGLIGSILVSGAGVLDFRQEMSSRSAAVAIDVHGDESLVFDDGKRITTSTYESGEFAIHYHYTTRYADIGSHVLIVRKDGG